MAGLVERSRIPLWIVPAELIAKAARGLGVSPTDLEDERDGAAGVVLRPKIGRQVLDEAVALWREERASHNPLLFTVETQERPLWCWAAVAASVADYYNTENSFMEQCDVVNSVLEKAFCCGQGEHPKCNEERDLETPLDHVGVSHTPGPAPAFLGDIQPEIADERLLCFRVRWDEEVGPDGAMAHFAVISGWSDDPEPRVWIEDPIGYRDWVPLEQLIDDGEYRQMSCTWTNTHFTEGPPERIRVPDDVWALVVADTAAEAGVR